MSNQIRYCMTQKEKWKLNVEKTENRLWKWVVTVNRNAVCCYKSGMLQGKKSEGMFLKDLACPLEI